MGMAEWHATQRRAFERGELTPEQYARKLEERAQRESEQGTKEFLKSRARFIRNDALNKQRSQE